MPEFKFTKRSVDEVPFTQDGQVLYRDSQLKGLGLRVGKASKVYFAEGQLNRRTKRISLGRADILMPDIARKHAIAVLSDLALGRVDVGSDEPPTLATAFERFLDEKRGLANCTRDAYDRTARLYLKSWRAQKLTSISRMDVLEKHRRISDKHGAITANNVFRHFRSVYNYTAARFEEFKANPTTILTQARAWNPERRRQSVIGARDLPAWWSALEDDTDDARDLLRLGILTGMRRSELCKLRWENLDFVARTMLLPNTKNGDPHLMPMSWFIYEILEKRRERVGQSEWVFPSHGKTGHIVETKSIVKRISQASGIPFAMHDLRRTFVTIAESLDIPHYALKRLLNHRSGGDVTGGYIVIDAERLREPMERVSARTLELANVKKQADCST